MVDRGSDHESVIALATTEGRKVFETAGVNYAYAHGFRKPENAGMDREMPFLGPANPRPSQLWQPYTHSPLRYI